MSWAGGIPAAPLTAAAHTTSDDGEPPVTLPRDPAREEAERELSEGIYHQDDPGLFERALQWVWEGVSDLLDRAASAAPGGHTGLWIVVGGLLLVLVLLVARVGLPGRRPKAAAEEALFTDGPRSAAEHRKAAEDAAARGDWSRAVQERTRAMVRSLEERALLDARPGRTADEAAAEAGRVLPGHADRLRTAAHDFDDVTYGGRTAAEDTYRRTARLDEDLRKAKPLLADGATPAGGGWTSPGAAV
ncbi:hypothetical protein M2169_003618 [Streptomyces sp. MJP52]|uniref:DUF4129 domain-containing protein n=1 Tax=Streptomyces chilikensis TaxID=1194079 RepID=UPI001407507C|nr:hypothetical protein [Streptomyces sp. MJP52]